MGGRYFCRQISADEADVDVRAGALSAHRARTVEQHFMDLREAGEAGADFAQGIWIEAEH